MRISCFNKCLWVVNSVTLGLALVRRSLLNRGWWREHCKVGPGADPNVFVSQFDRLLRRGMVDYVCSAVESSLRSLLRAVDVDACAGATAQFRSVYVCLLARLGLRHWESVLDFWRLVRNTVHNNGAYFPTSGGDRTMIFEGTTYEFRVGKQIDCAGWDVAIALADKARAMLLEIVDSPAIASMPRVEDIFAPETDESSN